MTLILVWRRGGVECESLSSLLWSDLSLCRSTVWPADISWKISDDVVLLRLALAGSSCCCCCRCALTSHVTWCRILSFPGGPADPTSRNGHIINNSCMQSAGRPLQTSLSGSRCTLHCVGQDWLSLQCNRIYSKASLYNVFPSVGLTVTDYPARVGS